MHTVIWAALIRNEDKRPFAIDTFRATLKLKPDHLNAYANLVVCLQTVCDWTDHDDRIKWIIKMIAEELEKKDWAPVSAFNSSIYQMSHELRKTFAAHNANCSIRRIQKLQKSNEYKFSRNWPILNVCESVIWAVILVHIQFCKHGEPIDHITDMTHQAIIPTMKLAK